MSKLIEILWVEDETDTRLVERKTRIEGSGKYDLDIARNATEGEKFAKSKMYDLIIIDIRIPPGEGEKWKLYHFDLKNKDLKDRLGILLIKFLLLEKVIKNDRIGVFTIERWSEIEILLEGSEIRKAQHLHKVYADIPEIFEDFIDKIYHDSNK